MMVVSFSMAYRSFRGGSGRLDTHLDTPPSINRRHPDSCLARRNPAQHSALPDAAAELGLHGGDARQAAGGAGRAAKGTGDCRQGSAGTEAVVKAAELARRDREPRTQTIQLSSSPAAKLWSRR